MPERTIQKLIWLDWSHGKYGHNYCIMVDVETWDSFSLTGSKGEFVRCMVSQLLDEKGNVLVIIGKDFKFKTYYYISTINLRMCRLLLPQDVVQTYGVKSDQYIDLLLLEVIRPSGERIEIFPKRLSASIIEIHPKIREGVKLPLSDILVDTEFTDKYYSELVMELNRAYGYGLYCATLILVRKLFENLLIDLLRTRYGMRELELFFWKERGMHHSLSTLIGNLHTHVSNFKPYTRAFDNEFFKFMNAIKEKGDASAHSLDISTNPDLLDSWKTSINRYSKLILSIIRKMQGRTP